MAEASPDPGAVVEGTTLSSSAVDLGNAINAGSGARGRHEVTVEGAMNIPGVALRVQAERRCGFENQDEIYAILGAFLHLFHPLVLRKHISLYLLYWHSNLHIATS